MGVMGDEYGVLGEFKYFLGDLFEEWCIFHHMFLDAGEFLDDGGNGDLGLDKGGELLDNFFSIEEHHSDIDNFIFLGDRSCGF